MTTATVENKTLEFPKVQVDTPYGTVTVEFLSPLSERERAFGGAMSREYKGYYEARAVGPDLHVTGEIVVNGIAFKLNGYYAISQTMYKDNVELDAPVPYLRQHSSYGDQYRRADGGGHDYKAKYNEKIRKMLGESVLPLYCDPASATLRNEANRVQPLRDIEREEQAAEELEAKARERRAIAAELRAKAEADVIEVKREK